MSDQFATPEEMEKARLLSEGFQHGWDAAQAEFKANASRSVFDAWSEQYHPDGWGKDPRETAWMGWQAGYEQALLDDRQQSEDVPEGEEIAF